MAKRAPRPIYAIRHCPPNAAPYTPKRGELSFDMAGFRWTVIAWDDRKRSLYISRPTPPGVVHLSPTGLQMDTIVKVMTNTDDQWDMARVVWHRVR
jgi:hypothetical protein